MAEQTDKINCSICLNDFTEPKTIECGHGFCLKCLEDYITKVGKDNRFPCPLCRQDVTIPVGGIKNLSSTTEIESIKRTTTKCDVCKRKVESKFNCLDCKKCFCLSCKTPHDSFFSDHHVSDLAHSRNTTKRHPSICNHHTLEKLEFYCKDCCQTICNECQISDHKGHDTMEMNAYGNEVRIEMENLKTQFQQKIAELEKYVDDTNKKIFDMNASAVTSSAKIDQQVKAICEAVTTKGREFKLRMQRALQKEEHKMKRVVESTNNFIDQLKESMYNINVILKGDSMYGVLDLLPSIRCQQEDNEAHKLTMIYDVYSTFNTGNMDTATLNSMIGNLEIVGQAAITNTFKYYSQTNHIARYSPVYGVEDELWYIRASRKKYTINQLNVTYSIDYVDVGMVLCGAKAQPTNTVVTMELISNNATSNIVSKTLPLTREPLATVFDWQKVCQCDEMKSFISNDTFTVKGTISKINIMK
ncbi:E3 ubiquitin-protein ligase TRIM56-like [Patella vulgata]|uniref:E3 ubiquitin-protein ligase TRIM56-like n=1 Tax=Patella vulgata TaxID=6465 RepID=UPI0024A9083B|nr:E3 ubiquitin-protein ligase TRIM56-like [Patella vulgata]